MEEGEQGRYQMLLKRMYTNLLDHLLGHWPEKNRDKYEDHLRLLSSSILLFSYPPYTRKKSYLNKPVMRGLFCFISNYN